MGQRFRAVYRNGVFRPESPCDLPDNSPVELLVEGPLAIAPSVTDPDEQRRVLRRVTDRMQNNPLPASAPRLTRDEMHERR